MRHWRRTVRNPWSGRAAVLAVVVAAVGFAQPAPGQANRYDYQYEYGPYENQFGQTVTNWGDRFDYDSGVNPPAWYYGPPGAYDYEYYGPYSDYYNNDYDYPYNDYEYGYHYDPYTDEWEYGYYYDPYAYNGLPYYDEYGNIYNPPYRFQFNRELTGTVVGLDQLRSQIGLPDSVRLRIRTPGGQVRSIMLGDVAFVGQHLPYIRKGEQVRLRGTEVNVDGRRLFHAEQIGTSAGSAAIPQYEYQKAVTGRVARINAVRSQDGVIRDVIATVRTSDGKSVDVLLGSPRALQQGGTQVVPGEKVNVEGYTRSLNGRTTFFAQKVSPVKQSQGDNQRTNRVERRTTSYASQRFAPYSAVARHETIRGKLLRTRPETIEGTQNVHRVAEVRVTDGRIATVDLGPIYRADNLDLQSGDRVTVTGLAGRLNGEPVLIARALHVAGREAATRQSASRQSGSSNR